jgi:uncharacterized membrane protein
MGVILFMLGLLFGIYLILTVAAALSSRLRTAPELRGRIALAAVVAFAASGHFVQTDGMSQMLPPWVPMRVPVILATGVLEIAIAAALLVPRLARPTGIFLIVYLVLIFPSNVYAALVRAPMGGHAMGPKYLWVRAPLQLLLIAWTWWFAVKRRPYAAPGPTSR